MKLIVRILVFGILLIMFNVCDKDDDLILKLLSILINKIFFLGVLRVEGVRFEYESYCYEFWKDLIENNWIFDFIGI